jgi:lipoyl(octanoyl) transferase
MKWVMPYPTMVPATMSSVPPEIRSTKPSVSADRVAEFHLLGRIPWEDALALQRRLVYEAGGDVRQHITVLLCEHPEVITVGRDGSRGHIRYTDEQLRRERLPVRWVGRGGGCVLHAPGQLCVYPILSLRRCGWSVGDYLRRLHAGLREALEPLSIRAFERHGRFSVWGRSGLLAALGVSVQNWVTCHGAFVNVNPAMSRFALIDTIAPEAADDGEKTTMSCLLAERRLAVRMTSFRAALVPSLATAFSCSRYHVCSGHPLLRKRAEPSRERIARAS